MAYHSRHNRNGYTTMHFTPDGSARPGRGIHLNAPRRDPASYGSWHSHAHPHLAGLLRAFDRRFLVIAAVVLAIVIIAIARGCAGPAEETTESAPVPAEEPSQETVSHMTGAVSLENQSDWDWSNLGRDDDARYRYVMNDETVSKFGIDVSDLQGNINWSEVADDGVQFALIRLGFRTTDEGALARDQLFRKNLVQARDAGILVGAYFYSQATTADEAREEAQFVIDALDGAELDYPIVLDLESSDPNMESRIAEIGQDQATENAIEFCHAVQDAGYDAMIYGNAEDLQLIDYAQLAEAVGDVPVWYASYSSAPDSDASLAIWQYSSTGTVNGIDTNVDLNLQLVE